MSPDQIVIPRRFNGPPDSGNGGYVCGMLASQLEGSCKVRLHSPPPLDKPLALQKIDPHHVELRDGELLLGTAISTVLEMDVPPAPTLERAELASKGYRGFVMHTLPTCFVCGTARSPLDGLCLFPGPVDNGELLACSWQPSRDLLDARGNVRPEIVWSALDCPGCFAALGDESVVVLLGELYAELKAPVPGDKALIVFAWPLGREGRKYYGGAAIANQDGEVLACSRSTWIVLRDQR